MWIAVISIVLLHSAVSFGLRSNASSRAALRGFHLPSVALAWGWYLWYETVHLPATCPGECNIRVDLLLIWPWLVFVSLAAWFYFRRCQRELRH